ncbi:MAG: RluA family pseudouridine synthase [Lachnospiraceae bacterium]|nr:RluA family pseudouridine synthase [Lachnospiraceae bacterium]
MDKMIVYEDDTLLVVHKPAGIATETAKIGQADVVSELKNYRKKKGESPYIGVIHRLDQPVEGLLVFAKDTKTAKKLSADLQGGQLSKKYVAIVAGIPQAQEGELSDYLIKDGRTNLSKVVAQDTDGAKRAVLRWKLLESSSTGTYALLAIELYTGRHHQIRVQMAHAGFPLLGDTRYGTAQTKELSRQLSVHNAALLANELCLIHPATGKRMEFSLDINKFLQLFTPAISKFV